VRALRWCRGRQSTQISGKFQGARLEGALRNSALTLAIYFLAVGGVSIVRHARDAYAFNTFPRKLIPKDGESTYLRGVELSTQAEARLSRIDDLLQKNNGISVYWGTGLELMNRIHPGIRDSALPLWYHVKISILETDTPAVTAAIDRTGATLFVADRMVYEYFLFPKSMRRYFAHGWVLEEMDDSLVVYRKKPGGKIALAAGD
jgi:hypothetical protein